MSSPRAVQASSKRLYPDVHSSQLSGEDETDLRGDESFELCDSDGSPSNCESNIRSQSKDRRKDDPMRSQNKPNYANSGTSDGLRSRKPASDHQPESIHSSDSTTPATLQRRSIRDAPRVAYGGGMDLWDYLPSYWWLICILILGLILAIFLFRPSIFNFSAKPKDNLQNGSKFMEIFSADMQKLRSDFPSQHNRLWSVVRAALKDAMARDEQKSSALPREPAVVIFVADERDVQGKATRNCLSEKLASITSRAIGNGNGRIFYFDLKNNADSKKNLDHLLKDYLEETSENRVVLLRNMDFLSAQNALTLHAYCDNENAPYKKAAFYLTVDCPNEGDTEENDREQPEENGSKIWYRNANEWDRMAERCLRKHWLKNELNVDKIGALLSRLANSVIFVFAEQNGVC